MKVISKIKLLAIAVIAVSSSAFPANESVLSNNKPALNHVLHKGSKGTQSQYIRKEPYMIYTDIQDEMQILWQLYQTNTCLLEWGTDLNYNLGSVTTVEYGNSHQHTYTLTGLQLETIYYFRLTVNSDVITGKFKSAPADTKDNLTFITYGDTRSHPNHHNDVAEQILNVIDNDDEALSLVIFSGDFVADGDDEGDWDTQFFSDNYPFIRELMTREPYMSSVGNHEGNGVLFAKYFPYPFYAGGDYYFSFDYGPAHFTIIDQYSPYTPGTTQYQWIENDLATTSKSWKFILLHSPGWSAGGGHENNMTVQNYIQPLCEQYGVQFIIGGHNHYYACAVVGSVVHITTGGGGAPQYDPDPTYPNIITVAKEYHFCKVEINQNNLHFTAINDEGDIIHEFDYADLVPPTTMNNAACIGINDVPLTNCIGEVAPLATIQNNGSNILSSVEINYCVNDEAVHTFNWLGTLNYNETTTVSLPSEGFTLMNENNLSVYTTNPNGNQDEDPAYDTTYQSFQHAAQVEPNIYLFLKLDNHPEETSWELKNSAGNVLYSGDNYTQSLEFIKDTFALVLDDCYTFSIYDASGNGLSDGGYYALRESNFSVIYQNNDFSTANESIQFSIDQVGISTFDEGPEFTILTHSHMSNPLIIYRLGKTSNVSIRIYNLLGESVFSKSSQVMEPGVHRQMVNANKLHPGIYFVSLKKNHTILTRKFILK